MGQSIWLLHPPWHHAEPESGASTGEVGVRHGENKLDHDYIIQALDQNLLDLFSLALDCKVTGTSTFPYFIRHTLINLFLSPAMENYLQKV